MDREEIIAEIERLIDEHWVYYDDDTHRLTATKIIEFLEDIGYDTDISLAQSGRNK